MMTSVKVCCLCHEHLKRMVLSFDHLSSFFTINVHFMVGFSIQMFIILKVSHEHHGIQAISYWA